MLAGLKRDLGLPMITLPRIPTADAVGTTNVTLTATNRAGTTTEILVISIEPAAPEITSRSNILPTAPPRNESKTPKSNPNGSPSQISSANSLFTRLAVVTK